MTAPKFNFPDPPEPKGGQTCLFCGGSDLIRNVKALDRDHAHERPLEVGKDRKPGALVFKGRERSETSAVVCGTCGFLHLFATSPGTLKRAGS